MKYPLACVEKLLETYGHNIGLGYDIACAFMKTLANSSLGPKAEDFRLRGVVPAFHGHAHNRKCQLDWHPMYIQGIGLEDFEECERTFSKSNELASVTRFATPFHRRQQIEQHFHFHSEDKYTESGMCRVFEMYCVNNSLCKGNFIYENYRQALKHIKEGGQQLGVLEGALGLTSHDYEEYLKME